MEKVNIAGANKKTLEDSKVNSAGSNKKIVDYANNGDKGSTVSVDAELTKKEQVVEKLEKEEVTKNEGHTAPPKRDRTSSSMTPKAPLRSTRSSNNPEFVAKQRYFLQKVNQGVFYQSSEEESDSFVSNGQSHASKRKRSVSGGPVSVETGTVVKGSPSADSGTPSNSINLQSPLQSSGSKANSSMKKRKSEVEGLTRDIYCWVCHKEIGSSSGGSSLSCEVCPRVYHARCCHSMDSGSSHMSSPSNSSASSAASPPSKKGWACPECVRILRAETLGTRSRAMQLISMDQLCTLLKFVLARVRSVTGADPFYGAVDLQQFPRYREYVANPMDLGLIDRNIRRRTYGSTEAFLADIKWIVHNSIIFNTQHSKLSSIARSMVKICRQELMEIENCPDCYSNAHTRKDNWFIDVCRRPHILVWAKLKGFPHWPAKAMRINKDSCVDVRFFGAHDRAWVPARDCYLYSQEMPAPPKNRKKNNFDGCIMEVEDHIKKLKEKYGAFVYAPLRTVFDPSSEDEILLKMLPKYQPINMDVHGSHTRGSLQEVQISRESPAISTGTEGESEHEQSLDEDEPGTRKRAYETTFEDSMEVQSGCEASQSSENASSVNQPEEGAEKATAGKDAEAKEKEDVKDKDEEKEKTRRRSKKENECKEKMEKEDCEVEEETEMKKDIAEIKEDAVDVAKEEVSAEPVEEEKDNKVEKIEEEDTCESLIEQDHDDAPKKEVIKSPLDSVFLEDTMEGSVTKESKDEDESTVENEAKEDLKVMDDETKDSVKNDEDAEGVEAVIVNADEDTSTEKLVEKDEVSSESVVRTGQDVEMDEAVVENKVDTVAASPSVSEAGEDESGESSNDDSSCDAIEVQAKDEKEVEIPDKQLAQKVSKKLSAIVLGEKAPEVNSDGDTTKDDAVASNADGDQSKVAEKEEIATPVDDEVCDADEMGKKKTAVSEVTVNKSDKEEIEDKNREGNESKAKLFQSLKLVNVETLMMQNDKGPQAGTFGMESYKKSCSDEGNLSANLISDKIDVNKLRVCLMTKCANIAAINNEPVENSEPDAVPSIPSAAAATEEENRVVDGTFSDEGLTNDEETLIGKPAKVGNRVTSPLSNKGDVGTQLSILGKLQQRLSFIKETIPGYEEESTQEKEDENTVEDSESVLEGTSNSDEEDAETIKGDAVEESKEVEKEDSNASVSKSSEKSDVGGMKTDPKLIKSVVAADATSDMEKVDEVVETGEKGESETVGGDLVIDEGGGKMNSTESEDNSSRKGEEKQRPFRKRYDSSDDSETSESEKDKLRKPEKSISNERENSTPKQKPSTSKVKPSEMKDSYSDSPTSPKKPKLLEIVDNEVIKPKPSSLRVKMEEILEEEVLNREVLKESNMVVVQKTVKTRRVDEDNSNPPSAPSAPKRARKGIAQRALIIDRCDSPVSDEVFPSMFLDPSVTITVLQESEKENGVSKEDTASSTSVEELRTSVNLSNDISLTMVRPGTALEGLAAVQDGAVTRGSGPNQVDIVDVSSQNTSNPSVTQFRPRARKSFPRPCPRSNTQSPQSLSQSASSMEVRRLPGSGRDATSVGANASPGPSRPVPSSLVPMPLMAMRGVNTQSPISITSASSPLLPTSSSLLSPSVSQPLAYTTSSLSTPSSSFMAINAQSGGPSSSPRLPNLHPRPPTYPLSGPQPLFTPAEAGPLSAEFSKHAHKLASYMRHAIEDVLGDLSRMGNPEAAIKLLRLEVEKLRWEHQQEIAELKHNQDLVIMEMRTSLEKEKVRLVNDVRRHCETEKLRSIEETKRKQWCANCSKEALFYCCWNTSYCDYPCQQAHWPRHMSSCAQNNSMPEGGDGDSNSSGNRKDGNGSSHRGAAPPPPFHQLQRPGGLSIESHPEEDYYDEDSNSPSTTRMGSSGGSYRVKRRRCGMCKGCLVKNNCGNCAPCRNSKTHQVCRMRRCRSLQSDWVPGGTSSRTISPEPLNVPLKTPPLTYASKKKRGANKSSGFQLVASTSSSSSSQRADAVKPSTGFPNLSKQQHGESSNSEGTESTTVINKSQTALFGGTMTSNPMVQPTNSKNQHQASAVDEPPQPNPGLPPLRIPPKNNSGIPESLVVNKECTIVPIFPLPDLPQLRIIPLKPPGQQNSQQSTNTLSDPRPKTPETQPAVVVTPIQVPNVTRSAVDDSPSSSMLRPEQSQRDNPQRPVRKRQPIRNTYLQPPHFSRKNISNIFDQATISQILPQVTITPAIPSHLNELKQQPSQNGHSSQSSLNRNPQSTQNSSSQPSRNNSSQRAPNIHSQQAQKNNPQEGQKNNPQQNQTNHSQATQKGNSKPTLNNQPQASSSNHAQPPASQLAKPSTSSTHQPETSDAQCTNRCPVPTCTFSLPQAQDKNSSGNSKKNDQPTKGGKTTASGRRSHAKPRKLSHSNTTSYDNLQNYFPQPSTSQLPTSETFRNLLHSEESNPGVSSQSRQQPKNDTKTQSIDSLQNQNSRPESHSTNRPGCSNEVSTLPNFNTAFNTLGSRQLNLTQHAENPLGMASNYYSQPATSQPNAPSTSGQASQSRPVFLNPHYNHSSSNPTTAAVPGNFSDPMSGQNTSAQISTTQALAPWTPNFSLSAMNPFSHASSMNPSLPNPEADLPRNYSSQSNSAASSNSSPLQNHNSNSFLNQIVRVENPRNQITTTSSSNVIPLPGPSTTTRKPRISRCNRELVPSNPGPSTSESRHDRSLVPVGNVHAQSHHYTPNSYSADNPYASALALPQPPNQYSENSCPCPSMPYNNQTLFHQTVSGTTSHALAPCVPHSNHMMPSAIRMSFMASTSVIVPPPIPNPPNFIFPPPFDLNLMARQHQLRRQQLSSGLDIFAETLRNVPDPTRKL